MGHQKPKRSEGHTEESWRSSQAARHRFEHMFRIRASKHRILRRLVLQPLANEQRESQGAGCRFAVLQKREIWVALHRDQPKEHVLQQQKAAMIVRGPAQWRLIRIAIAASLEKVGHVLEFALCIHQTLPGQMLNCDRSSTCVNWFDYSHCMNLRNVLFLQFGNTIFCGKQSQFMVDSDHKGFRSVSLTSDKRWCTVRWKGKIKDGTKTKRIKINESKWIKMIYELVRTYQNHSHSQTRSNKWLIP